MINSNLPPRLRLSSHQRSRLLALSNLSFALSLFYLAAGFCVSGLSSLNLGFFLACVGVGLSLVARHMAKEQPESATIETMGSKLKGLVPPTTEHPDAQMLRSTNRPVKYEPRWTIHLIVINIVIWFIMANQPGILNWGSMNRVAVLEWNEYYRVLTAIFLNFDTGYFLLNMFALFLIGRVIEHYFGSVRFLLIYVIGGLCGSLSSIISNAPNLFGIGATGAIFALAGSQLVLHLRYRNVLNLGNAGRNSAFTIALILAYDWFFRSINPYVDTSLTLLGGLVGGIGIAWVCTQFFNSLDLSSGAPLLVEAHPRAFRILVIAALAIIAILSSTVRFFVTSHTLTVEDITVTVPVSWQTTTELDDLELCSGRGTECLLYGVAANYTWFEITRFSSLGLALSTLESFDAGFAEEAAQQGSVLVSKQSIQIDGHDAVMRLYNIGQVQRMYVFIWDLGRVVRFVGESPKSEFKNYSPDMEVIATSVIFQEK